MNGNKHFKGELPDALLHQTVFEFSLAGFLVVDGKGFILKANPAADKMFGYAIGSLIGKNMETLFVDSFKKEYRNRVVKNIAEPLQLLAVHKKNREFLIDIRIAPTVLKGQKIAAVYCKPYDTSLFESDRKFRTLIGNVSGIVYRCKIDMLWTMKFISDACLAISGYAPKQFYENGDIHWGNLIHPDDRDRVWKEVKKAISSKKSYQLSYRIRSADDRVKWIWEQGSGVEDENGKIYRLEGFMQDITQLKETEYALKKEKETLGQYLNTAASMFLVINKDHTIALVNRKASEVLGYKAHEIEGQNWFNRCIPKNERKELVHFFDRIMDGTVEPPDVYENWVVAKGNKRKLIRWRNSLLKDRNGKVTGLISSGVDVTEEVIAHQKLRKSEQKNRAILRAFPDLVFVCDKKGTVLHVNTSRPNELVMPREEMVGKNVVQFLPSETSRTIKRALAEAHRSKKIVIEEVEIPVKGVQMFYETRFVPYDTDKILTIPRNITETKTIQKTLHLRNRALEAAGNGIIITDAKDPDLPIIYCNTAFSRLTGYRRSEVIGRNCRFLQNDDRDQEAIKMMTKSVKKGEACNVTLRNYRKDGSLFWNELSITPLYDEEQQLTHFIGVQNDVTEIQENRKQLENYAQNLEKMVEKRTEEVKATVQKLVETNLSLEDQVATTKLAESKAQRSQAQFAAIAKNFPKGLIAVFNSDFELVYIEGEELKRVNLKKADFEGKRIDDVPIFSTQRIENIKAHILETIKGNSLSFEVEFQDNFYSVNSTPLFSDEGAVVWALFVYHNVTQQKKVQKELANALKAEQELNELKSRFISMASHEFRTPLSAILSSAILIGKQNEPGKEERREKHVERIRTHVKHLVVILNDFLSLSKLEEGKVQAKPQHFELIRFCKIVVDEMEATKKEGQTIRLKHTEVEIPVFLDPKLMSHILINLLSNALKYSEEGKEVVLELLQTGETVLFKITDKGIGIPKQEQKNLFERFFRAENVTNIQGTGLGLHIVKQYSELMGGAVSFTSKTGKGSTFTVQLPLNLNEHEKNTIN